MGFMKKPSTQEVPKEVREAVQKAMKEAADKLRNTDITAHYREALDFLDDNFAFFLTHVLNLGRPQWNASIPTAAVALPRKDAGMEEFFYIFNPTFAALMEPEELAFVAAHETMHILLNHLRLLQNGQKVGKFKDDRKFNLAADCVINDYLESMGLKPGRLKDMLIFGQKTVGYNCSNSTVSEVYRDIPEQKQDTGGDGSDPLSKYVQGSGCGEGEASGSHEWMRDTSGGQADSAEDISKDAADNAGTPQDLQDKKDDDDRKGTPGAGPGSEAGRMAAWTEQKGVSMKWAELLKEVDPDYFKAGGPRPRPSYHKTPRKLVGVYEHYKDLGVLPVKRDPDNPKGEHPSIAMYLDGSGSCSDWIDRFVALAKSVDQKKIKLWAYTFSTYVAPLDLDADNPKMATGGTAFGPIQNSIKNDIEPELGHYPSAVVVLTDLEGAFNGQAPNERESKGWVWLATHGGAYDWRDVKPGKVLDIEKFMEGMPISSTKVKA